MPDQKKVYVQHARREDYAEWVAAMRESFSDEVVEVMERYAHSGLISPEDQYKVTLFIGKPST